MADSEEVMLGQEGTDDFGFDPTCIDSFDLGITDFRDQEGVEYPAILLSRVLFMDSLLVLKSLKRASYREFDAWLELPDDGGYQKIGTLPLNSDMLLILRHLKIGVTLYKSREEMEVLNLEDPEVLERFI